MSRPASAAATLLKRLGWGLALLLLPLALMGWSLVQQWRAEQGQAQTQIIRQWLVAPEDELLQALPWATREQLRGRVDPHAVLQRELTQLDDDRPWLAVRSWLAAGSCWLALGALLSGLATALNVRIDAWRALHSARYLQARMAASWHALGWGLSVYLGLLASALGLSLLYEISAGVSHAASGGLTVLFVVLPLATVLFACLGTLWRVRRQWPVMLAPQASFLGRTLDRQAAPALWQWIEGLAAHLQAPVPEHVVVGLDQGLFVTSVPIVLQPSGVLLQGRTLYLPLPWLGALSQDEAAALVGHELGHFRSRDTERGSEINAQYSLMCAHFAVMLGAEQGPHWGVRPALWMAALFLQQFRAAVHRWGRDQELLADQAGAQVAGARQFAQALLRAIALAGVVERLLDQCGGGGLLEGLALELQQAPLQLDEIVLELTSTHPFDTHPAVATRLDNLNVLLDASLVQAAMRVPSADDRRWFNRLCQALPADD